MVKSEPQFVLLERRFDVRARRILDWAVTDKLKRAASVVTLTDTEKGFTVMKKIILKNYRNQIFIKSEINNSLEKFHANLNSAASINKKQR